MVMSGTRVTTIPGYVVVEIDGKSTQYPLKIRAVDIPALTYAQVRAIKTLANLFVVAIRALIEKDLLSDDVLEDGGYDLAAIVETLEGMGADFGEPDLTVS